MPIKTLISAFALVSSLQTAVLCTVLSFIGLSAAGSLELKTPHLQRWVNRVGDHPSWQGLGRSMLIGAGIAGVVVVVDLGVLLPLLSPTGEQAPSPGPFVGLTGGLKRVSLRASLEGTRSGHFARNH